MLPDDTRHAPRNYALDGLRGIAALAVALGHCDLATTGSSAWALTLDDIGAAPIVDIGGRLLYL